MKRIRTPSSWLARSAHGVLDTASQSHKVVAGRDLVAGETVAIFGGSIVDGASLTGLGRERLARTLQVDDDAFLVSDRDGPGDWINHSCDPCLGFRGQLTLVTLRAVNKGADLTFDYAMSDTFPYDEFECGCGAWHCRGRVSSEDWTRPELQHRYRGYFSTYVEHQIRRQDQERIERERWLERDAVLSLP